MASPIRVLAFLEANSVTGPARNLLEFCQIAPGIEPPLGPIEVIVATFRRPGQRSSDPFLDAASRLGVPVEILAERNALDFSTLGKIRALCARLQPDLIQTHAVKSHFLMWLSGVARGIPWIAWHHGYTAPTIKQKIYNQFDRVSLRAARSVITVTGAFLPELQDYGIPAHRIQVIRNAIPPRWMEQAGELPTEFSRQAPGNSSAKVLLAVGRLSKEKGHADLIEAVALLQRRGLPEFHVLLVGEGPERGALEALARERRVPVTFAGQRSDVRPFYSLCDSFVLPSHSEGSPNVLIEAMAAAKPIVATTAGGVGETVEHRQEALLVPSGNPQAMAEAILELAEHPETASAIAAAARERVRRDFLPEPRALKIAMAYRRALSPAGTGAYSEALR